MENVALQNERTCQNTIKNPDFYRPLTKSRAIGKKIGRNYSAEEGESIHLRNYYGASECGHASSAALENERRTRNKCYIDSTCPSDIYIRPRLPHEIRLLYTNNTGIGSETLLHVPISVIISS
jgi:hypothetical protein